MARLEDLKRGASVKGILPGKAVTVIDVSWHGTNAVELVYKDETGRADNRLLFRESEPGLELITDGRPWSFEADGDLLRLVSEAQRIRWAHLFDPYVAVNTSLVEPLPHQITAVYEEMLPRQPLRFLLADDPGAGKTIMTGLFIKELIIRGDLGRCLIVCPGGLVEQWQDELYEKFSLPFDILTRDLAETARTGNIFSEKSLLIARLDQVARGDDLRAQLEQTDWDLIVVDEAHKLSATYFGGEVKYTKRYHLGRQLSGLTRHFLLLTATPHNGKEPDFQLFMSLLDADRFEGKYREGIHATQASDLMRRMVKEQLVKFDGKPLFPERRAYTVPYKLSDEEAHLYKEVTDYVREEFNRAENLEEEGRRGTVGFALTILQRRLASSPEAIYQSLRRRRERLESYLREAELEHRVLQMRVRELDEEQIEDLDDALAEEVESLEEELVDQATAARTVEELRLEIQRLKELEALAQQVRRSGQDRKWEELSRLLQEQQEMFDAEGHRRKLVIFTEHRDTLTYLVGRIRTLLGRPEAVVTIHGGVRREERRRVQEAFKQDKEVEILVATDAAGEGINLQRAHLMINYDLPWNPNRLEQRFGRIHRIGQTEVCHLWNLVAEETREGDVYKTLLRKLEQERESLGGAVFDVLGKAMAGKELRQLMLEAIRYGDRPEVRARLSQRVEGALNHNRLRALMEEEALAHDVMDAGQVYRIKQEMERMQARRLQPHYIASFFREAFERLGGTMHEREPGRYEVTYVPASIRQRARRIGVREHVLHRYERICFEKPRVTLAGKPTADLIAPGHPLLDAVIDLILERYSSLMKQGAVLVDDADPGEDLRALIYLEHAIEDGRRGSTSQRLLASRRFQFAEINLTAASDGAPHIRDAGPAPYLDYRPLNPDEQERLAPLIERTQASIDLEQAAVSFAIQTIVPDHLAEVKRVREPRIERAMVAVKDRLTKEIMYWDHRAEQLKTEEQAGKVNARINSAKARQRADDLEARLGKRLEELEQERQLSARPPAVLGGALVVPAGLLKRLQGERETSPTRFARETRRVELAAMQAVMDAERAMGNQPIDVSARKVGYDVESLEPGEDGAFRFIEVKGRIAGAETVTLTRNEILTALNKPDEWILALVEVPLTEDFPEGDAFVVKEAPETYQVTQQCAVRYVQHPFQREPDFGATSVNYDWKTLWERGQLPVP